MGTGSIRVPSPVFASAPPIHMIELIHISDLHVAAPFHATERRFWKKRVGSHGFGFMLAATEAVARIKDAATYPVYGLVTGDCAADGSVEGLALSRQFIERSKVHASGVVFEVGLALGPLYSAVPGNHDRFGPAPIQADYKSFESEYAGNLRSKNHIAYGVKRKHARIRRLPSLDVVHSSHPDTPNLTAIVISVDSTELRPIDRARNPFGIAAQGRVSHESLKFIDAVMEDVRAARRVRLGDGTGRFMDLRGRDVITIVAMHHHPLLPPAVPLKTATVLLNAAETRTRLRRAGIHAVFFGHEHHAFIERCAETGLLCVAAGTLSKYGEALGNSFNRVQITHERIVTERWSYHRGVFRPQHSETWPRDLTS